jgi:hypothetical protein
VIDFARRVLKTRFEIIRLKVGKFFENLLRRQTSSEEIEYVRDPNAQTADAGATAALAGIRGDPRKQVWHSFTVGRWVVCSLHWQGCGLHAHVIPMWADKSPNTKAL